MHHLRSLEDETGTAQALCWKRIREQQRGPPLRVVVPTEALQEHFGAGAEPQNWLDVFNANTVAIEKAARHAQLKSGLSTVVLSAF
jgi:hypothetical protein